MITQYKKDISYLTLYYRTIKRELLLLILLLVGLQLGLMYHKVSNLSYKETASVLVTEGDCSYYSNGSTELIEGAPSFQNLVNQCRYSTIFIGTVALLFLLFLWQPIYNRNHGERNYTLQRMGVRLRRRYFLTAIANFLLILTFYIIENLTLVCSYSIYKTCIREEYVLFNGFFQAYVNNTFIRELCPVTCPVLFFYLAAFIIFLAFMITTAAYAGELHQYDSMIFYLVLLCSYVLILVPNALSYGESRWIALIAAVVLLAINFTYLHNIVFFKPIITDTMMIKED